MTDHEILLAIQDEMDGVEWSSDTLDRISSILQENGYRIRDIDEEMAAEYQMAQPREHTVLGLTKAQQQALKRVYERGSTLSYLTFRRTVKPGPGCVMVPFGGIVLGIEPDGYTHS